MVSSIASSLGIGAGFDTAQLIEDLAKAQRAPKEAQIKAREQSINAQISTVGNLSGAIDSFATSLKALIDGGTLFTQPTSSDTSILATSAVAGARLGGLSAQIEVVQLATAQSLASVPVADAAAPVGQGKMTLATSTGSFEITIGSGNDSLTGLAAAINGANAGVTASIVRDSSGARLMLRGPSGEAGAFTLVPQAGAAPGLSAYAYDGVTPGGMTRAQVAQDAIVKLDGVQVKRASNSFTDLLPGVKIELKKAAPGSIVNIGSDRPADALKQAVKDYVTAYNELERLLDTATAPGLDGAAAGPLRGNSIMRDMRKQLADITGTDLRGDADITRLTDIGIKTNRDGSLSVDNDKLDAVLASDPDAVEGLFNPATGELGLGGALQAVRDRLRDSNGPLAGADERLKREAKAVALDREQMELRADAYRARLVSTFTAMDTRVAAYKATQSYLDQQIKMWTRSSD